MRAEETLVRFALLSEKHSKDYVVIGGLNPDFLTHNPPVPHQGTTDIDLLFTLEVDAHSSDQDFSWIDDALETGGFTTENKWRWRAVLGGTPVLLEFLCDLLDHTADTAPFPAQQRPSHTS